MKILAIESSCDDTCASVVEDGYKVLSNVISSQIKDHQQFGGVFPELASRKHLENINYVIEKALTDAGLNYKDIDAVAVTNENGLIGGLFVSLSTAKAIAYSINKPLIGINHFEAHIYSNFLVHRDMMFPQICLTVSGGHSFLFYVEGVSNYSMLGKTLDDAGGEAFDKVSQMLGLGFPGGPIIDKLAKEGNPDAIDFPRPLKHENNYNFSFSGIKTAVKYYLRDIKADNKEVNIPDVCASFQNAVVDVLVTKTIKASKEYNVKAVSIVGGVSANSELRKQLFEQSKKHNLELYMPELKYCTDNAAMVGGLAYEKLKNGEQHNLTIDAYARKEIKLKQY
jgi:N6-L-threonylcarbamoyladenine synthase